MTASAMPRDLIALKSLYTASLSRFRERCALSMKALNWDIGNFLSKQYGPAKASSILE